MNSLKQTSIHIRCDQRLADEFKQVVEQRGYTKSTVLRELMQEYINKAKNPLVTAELATTDQAHIKAVLKQDAATRMTPLSDKAADDLLQLATRMAEKHI